MAVPNKRVLTDEVRETLVSSDGPSSSGTPEDLVQRLRSTASRARKSVTEGYRTPPSFSKAQSTGTIFQSMNDTIREVYSNLPANTNTTDNLTSRKRSRSVTGRDERGSSAEDSEIPLETEQEARTILPQSATEGNIPPFARPTKSLRTSRRALLDTQSLPNGSFSFGRDMGASLETHKHVLINEEDDWSAENSFQPSEQAFDPMVL